MLIAFQVIMILLMLFSLLFTIGAQEKESQHIMGNITIVSIIALFSSFLVN